MCKKGRDVRSVILKCAQGIYHTIYDIYLWQLLRCLQKEASPMFLCFDNYSNTSAMKDVRYLSCFSTMHSCLPHALPAKGLFQITLSLIHQLQICINNTNLPSRVFLLFSYQQVSTSSWLLYFSSGAPANQPRT